MTHDREPLDAQGAGDGGNIKSRRRQVAARSTSRSAVPRPVVRDPPQAELGGVREQRLGRRAEIRRAVMPEDGEAAIRITGGGVVDVEPASAC
jgi:hypothetical protein